MPEVETVFEGKLMKRYLEELLDLISVQRHERDTRIKQAVAGLRSLISPDSNRGMGGFLSKLGLADGGNFTCSRVQDASVTKTQNTANELGYVPLLLDFACEACKHAPSMSEAENELAGASYAVLGVLINQNREVVESVVESGGVRDMLRHLTSFHGPNTTWVPPCWSWLTPVAKRLVTRHRLVPLLSMYPC